MTLQPPSFRNPRLRPNRRDLPHSYGSVASPTAQYQTSRAPTLSTTLDALAFGLDRPIAFRVSTIKREYWTMDSPGDYVVIGQYDNCMIRADLFVQHLKRFHTG